MKPFVSTVYFGELVTGVNEVGCGSLSGEVIATSMILDPNSRIDGLADSKNLSKKKT